MDQPAASGRRHRRDFGQVPDRGIAYWRQRMAGGTGVPAVRETVSREEIRVRAGCRKGESCSPTGGCAGLFPAGSAGDTRVDTERRNAVASWRNAQRAGRVRERAVRSFAQTLAV